MVETREDALRTIVIFREGDVSGAPRLIHVIASEAKQSILSFLRRCGLLRCARN